jgi:hypothetical protein
MEGQRARLGEAQRAEVLDEARQDLRLLEDRLEVGLVDRVDPVDQGFEVALDHGERVAELVADLGEERPPLRLVGLQAGRHRVERPGEAAELHGSAADLRDADRVVAGLDPAGRIDEIAEGCRDPPGESQAAADGQDAEDEHDDRRQAHEPRPAARVGQPEHELQRPEDEDPERAERHRQDDDEAADPGHEVVPPGAAREGSARTHPRPTAAVRPASAAVRPGDPTPGPGLRRPGLAVGPPRRARPGRRHRPAASEPGSIGSARR